MSDCRFGVSPVNYPDPDPDPAIKSHMVFFNSVFGTCIKIILEMKKKQQQK